MVVKSKVKYIQSLSQKKVRDTERVFVAEGPKIINELLKEPGTQLQELFATEEWMKENPEPFASGFTLVDDILLSRLSHLSTPNQVIGIFQMPERGLFEPQNKVSLLLHNIQDPGNLGSIVRCADWFGVEQVVCSRDSADVFNPKAVQSTMGSIARVKVFYEDLRKVITEHKNIPVFAATLTGKSLNSLNVVEEGMIMIGNESKGISNDLLELAKVQVTIPRRGKAESLNAAVATGILLSKIFK